MVDIAGEFTVHPVSPSIRTGARPRGYSMRYQRALTMTGRAWTNAGSSADVFSLYASRPEGTLSIGNQSIARGVQHTHMRYRRIVNPGRPLKHEQGRASSDIHI